MSENVIHAVSGATAGMAAMGVTYPLVTLSTRAQVDARAKSRGNIADLKKILNTEGLPGLYAGLKSALIGIGITNGIYYFWYEWSKEFLENRTWKTTGKRRPLSTAESMLAGCIAGSATVMLTNPIWVVNTRETTGEIVDDKPVQNGNGVKKAVSRNKGFLSILRDIIRTEGIGALWSGVIPGLILVINPIIQYTAFEQLKTILERRRGSRTTPNDAFLLGALGKLLATGITYPYITIKARMQLKQNTDGSQPYTGTIAGIQQIIHNEGVIGLYKGIGPKLTQSVLNAAFLFMFKDLFFNSSKAVLSARLRK